MAFKLTKNDIKTKFIWCVTAIASYSLSGRQIVSYILWICSISNGCIEPNRISWKWYPLPKHHANGHILECNTPPDDIVMYWISFLLSVHSSQVSKKYFTKKENIQSFEITSFFHTLASRQWGNLSLAKTLHIQCIFVTRIVKLSNIWLRIYDLSNAPLIQTQFLTHRIPCDYFATTLCLSQKLNRNDGFKRGSHRIVYKHLWI